MFKIVCVIIVLFSFLAACEKQENTESRKLSAAAVHAGSNDVLAIADLRGEWVAECAIGATPDHTLKLFGQLRFDETGDMQPESYLTLHGAKLDASGKIEIVDATQGTLQGKMQTSDGIVSYLTLEINPEGDEMVGTFRNRVTSAPGKIHLTRVPK